MPWRRRGCANAVVVLALGFMLVLVAGFVISSLDLSGDPGMVPLVVVALLVAIRYLFGEGSGRGWW